MSLLDYKQDIHSQGGEDGVIARIFELIGEGNRTCCEFGAWDGVYLSNTRNLILQGWSAILIESDETRFKELVGNYRANPRVHPACRLVDDGRNSLSAIGRDLGVLEMVEGLDFLSIDIDGLDYEIFEGLEIRPKLICIETSFLLHPLDPTLIDKSISRDNIGQSLAAFNRLAEVKGYRLITFTGNAFFLRKDVQEASGIPTIDLEQAYIAARDGNSTSNKEWAYLQNQGLIAPYRRYDNPYLTRTGLGIPYVRALTIAINARLGIPAAFVKRALRKAIKGG